MNKFKIFFNYPNKEDEHKINLHAENNLKAERYFKLLIPEANINKVVKTKSITDKLKQDNNRFN